MGESLIEELVVTKWLRCVGMKLLTDVGGREKVSFLWEGQRSLELSPRRGRKEAERKRNREIQKL